MAATTCAYGYERSRPLMPAAPTTPPVAMGSPTPARSSQIMEPFDNDDRGHAAHGSIHGAVTPPPPPPPLPPLLELHLGARCNPSSSKATFHHLGLCTEGLGSESSESSGDIDLGDDTDKDADVDVGQALPYKRQHRDNDQEETVMPARTRSGRAFPPPISVIGAGGKPWLYLRAHRGDGRLVLREVRIPSRELLQACREDGRFKLQFAHPEEEEPVDDQCQEQEVKN